MTPDLASDDRTAVITLTKTGDSLALVGALTIEAVEKLVRAFSSVQMGSGGTVDIGGLTVMDTAGAWWVITRQTAGAQTNILNATPAQTQLIETVRQNMTPTGVIPPLPHGIVASVATFGARVATAAQTAKELLSFLG
ncbi:hypothetical protein SAMN05444339_12115 [Loktanella atrilutea]|uniref:STAS domain-containing protein n=1 Tax=Loktanella atrilutea TaxID=366533 RepID=A0A1M5FIM9_LOKAT|nr:hypothetical protein [Loktanella atrilutea]SHF91334.1 hypothetical protein SAMN05444339_12115 [Loktanella atrilutea]